MGDTWELSCLYLGWPRGPGWGSDRDAQGAKPVWLTLFPTLGLPLPPSPSLIPLSRLLPGLRGPRKSWGRGSKDEELGVEI